MPGSGSAESLEAALDELYAVDPSEFVATRKRLAAALRAAGDKAGAKSLQEARRPTTAAWALNRLSRVEASLVEAFLDRSRELASAQREAMSGERQSMREATRAQRDALAAATEGALVVLGSRATDAYRSQVLATLQAASADDALGEQLRLGRLVREASGSTGFPDSPVLTLVPSLDRVPAPEPKAKRKTQSEPRPDPEPDLEADRAAVQAEQRRLQRERAAVARAQQRLADAESAAGAAQLAAAGAEAAAADGHERIAQLERDLVEARRGARAADDAAARARREATRLARAATKLRSQAPR